MSYTRFYECQVIENQGQPDETILDDFENFGTLPAAKDYARSKIKEYSGRIISVRIWLVKRELSCWITPDYANARS